MSIAENGSRKLRVFVFCDALGYEIVSRHHFLEKELPWRYSLGMQFGYSSTAVPTFLSGKTPAEHKHFSFFYFDRQNKSPFRFFRFWQWMFHPRFFFDHHRVRHKLSAFLKKYLGFTGYFNLYSVPFDRLPYLDYCEKRDMYAPGGLEDCENIHDVLLKSGLRFHLSDWRRDDGYNLAEAAKLAASGEYDFLFVYTGAVDAMLHFHVGDFDYEARYLAAYREKLLALLNAARANYDDLGFYVFSDHGMTPLKGAVDVRSLVEVMPYRFGQDYAACYDSTMCRFWFLKPECRQPILDALKPLPGRWLTAGEKERWGVDFPDFLFGEEIFLLDPGYQAVPSDMGTKPIPGMHGYDPSDKDSAACLLSLHSLSTPPVHLRNVFDLMVREIENLRGRS